MITIDEATYLLYKLAGGKTYKETKSHTCVKEFTPAKMLEKQALDFVPTFEPRKEIPFVPFEIPQIKR